ncbi:MAG: amidohydrolase [SAR202 cluster bacterium]|nr:amidohydrolase [SAR202 cluster bacterium]
MFIDSHVHIYPNNPNKYPLPENKGEGNPNVEFLIETLDHAGVDKAVIVQPDEYDNKETTEYVAECLRRFPDRLAACGLINPQRRDAPEELERQVKEYGFGGTRLYLSRHKNPMELSFTDQDRLWNKVAELNVTFIVLASAQDLPYLEPIIARHPATKVVIDHMGRPGHFEPFPSPLLENVTKLVKYPSVYVKMSHFHGLSRQPYPHPDTQRIAKHLFETFGPKRMLYGSDFPGITRKPGYKPGVDIARVHVDFLKPEDREWVFHKTAESIWKWTG